MKILHEIVARASTLSERLAGRHVQQDVPGSASLAQVRLQQWRERAASDDPESFQKRLSWLQTTPEQVVHILGEPEAHPELPSWARIFAKAMEKTANAGSALHGARYPFGSLLYPFVVAGRELLESRCSDVFTPAILEKFADDLLQRLSYIAAPSLYLEFAVFRTSQGFSEKTAPHGSDLYDAFAQTLREGGLWNVFREYAALARLLATTVEYWARNTSELAQFLQEDLLEIQKVFAGNRSIGAVVSVQTSLSDTHDYGRTVSILEFQSGLKLVYKPRNLGIEKEWFTFLQYLNERGGDFRVLRVLDRKDRGWVELAEHSACQNVAEVKQFYTRAGMLLCVLYLLEASDCFYENVIASGSHPVLIDMETLMHHVLRQSADLAASEELASDILFDSVFRAGFLPAWESGAQGISVDISGLGAKVGQVSPYVKRSWDNINQNAMSLKHEPIRVETGDHLPELDGVLLTAADYSEEIVAGFRKMYELVMQRRSELGESLARLGRQEIRVVFHATRIYGLLLKRLATPRFMRSGVDRSIETDIVSRFYLENPEKQRFCDVLHAEIAALERLDIPRFEVMADSRSLTLPTGKVLQDAFEQTALERTQRRLASFSKSDMDLQTGLIRASLCISAISVRHESVSPENGQTAGVQESSLGSAEQLVTEARAIAAEIENRAILSADGGATWIAPQLLPGASHHQLRPLRMDLYNGLSGIALFFAALHHTTGNGRETALAALSPLRRFVAVADVRRMRREGYTVGAATGVGSFIYAFVRCALFLDEPALLADAAAAARHITPEWIAEDNLFDIMSGTAGAILCLLTLYEKTGDTALLPKAILCGERLLSTQEPAKSGRAWRTLHAKFMTGFSHGAAGIALALLRLYQASGDIRFQQAAHDAIAFENSTFDRDEGNWPDFRFAKDDHKAFMSAWCHGGPGIGLGRVSGLRWLDSSEIRHDVEAALASVSKSGIGGKDGLCCGNLGRADLLLAAAALPARGELHDHAVNLASSVVARARQFGGYRLSGQPHQDFFDPSFFQGLSGIGYELLRIGHPKPLPSVLVWE